MGFDNSFDYWDLYPPGSDERNYWDDIVEQFERRQNRERKEYFEDGPNYSNESRRRGVDESEAPPLWWIEKEGRKALEETFAGDDQDHADNRKPIQRFRFFKQNVRANNWF
jgi:hypothetical protein